MAPERPAANAILVPGSRQWVDTGIAVEAGEPLRIVAEGTIRFRHPGLLENGKPCTAGPAGTYLFEDEVAHKAFPLPAGAEGPAPAYCLIGRIGEGRPFYVGPSISFEADTSGRLLLGVNDFEVGDNCGRFSAQITKPATVQPIRFEKTIPDQGMGNREGGVGRPNSQFPTPHSPVSARRSVVIFYLDGLRPDVVREMAAMGHIPHIKRHFIDGGVWLANTFTAFPTDTITSNGTMWTGRFSDRHGLKGQVRFSRRTHKSYSYLEPLGPYRGSKLLAPQGIDRLVHDASAAAVERFQGDEAEEHWRQRQTSDVTPLYEHLRHGGDDWAIGALPLMTEMPPPLWSRSLMRHLPLLQTHKAWQSMDEANTHFTLWHLLGEDSPVTVVWLPETDSVSHKKSRGQFGMTRRTIAEADRLIGRVTQELQSRGRLRNTYLILVSDHGHHGGRNTYLSNFDLANKLFYKPRAVSPEGKWVGGGLGLSVRMHRFWNRHQGDGKREFVFIDGKSTGAARIYLPRGSYRSGDWSAPNRPGDLLAYTIDECLPCVNLLEALSAAQAVHGDGTVGHPVDLVLMKLSENSILISTADRGDAVIDRRRAADGRWVYRYRLVEDLMPRSDGGVAYRVVDNPHQAATVDRTANPDAPLRLHQHADGAVDPLGLLQHYSTERLASYHDESTWLELTAHTQYPDGVVALTRHMLWQQSIRHREHEFAPDLVVTARPGWYFGVHNSPGTMHGHPSPDAARASLFISGPNVRRGTRMDAPCRLVDLTPTILEMAGVPCCVDDFDGKPLRRIYESPVAANGAPRLSGHGPIARPVYWRDLNLDAWHPLQFSPRREYGHLPVIINKPSSPFDLNNMVHNVLSVWDVSVLRLLDEVLFPFSNGDGVVLPAVEEFDRRVRQSSTAPVAEGARTLNVSGITVGDYSATSGGNLKRADRAVDWLQHRIQTVDQTLARQVGRPRLPGSRQMHATVDGMQSGFWEGYRFVQRIGIQVVDEMLLNGIEDGIARAINAFRTQPAEVIVNEPKRRPNSLP